MDIRQLKYFVTIADCGSLSAASLRLHVVQSALSHNLAQLEEELEAVLFYRKPRGVELTQPGKVLYEYAQSVLQTMERAKAEIARSEKEEREQIWVGSNHTSTKLLLPELPRSLVHDFPDIKFGFIEDLSSILVSNLMEDKIDLTLTYNPPDDLPLIVKPLLREQVGCVGAPDLLSNTEDPLPFKDVISLPLILGQGGNMRGVARQNAVVDRLESACIMEINSLPVLMSALREGVGCSVLSAATVRKEVEQGELVLRTIIEPEITRDLCIAYREDVDEKSTLEALAEKIESIVRHKVTEHPLDGVQLI